MNWNMQMLNKKRISVIKLTFGQLVYFQAFQQFKRKLFIINFMNASMINIFLVNVDFVGGIVLNTVFQLWQRKIKVFSKAFDCIDYTLLTAFGVSHLSLKFIYSYLSYRIERVKINTNFSDRSDIEFVPQGSILGLLLFNTDVTDLFYGCEDSTVTSYSDDTTLYLCATGIPSVASKLFRWFKNNHLWTNLGLKKSPFFLSTKKPEIIWIDQIPLTLEKTNCNIYYKFTTDSIDQSLRITLKTYVSTLAKNLTLSAVYQVPCHWKTKNIN